MGGSPEEKGVAVAEEKMEDVLQQRLEKELQLEQKATAAGEALKKRILDRLGGSVENVQPVMLVSAVIELAVNSRATDIHFDPTETGLVARLRIDGMLHDVLPIPKRVQPNVVARLKVLAEMDISETRRPQDGHINMSIGERRFDLRVSALPTFRGEKMTLRVLDSTSGIPKLSELGMEYTDRVLYEEIITKPQGMTLVTGPTGSGKTTTLYASLERINHRTYNIITLEDPVEYQLKGINQVQINPAVELTFASTLRASLRQDPDTILVGEVRDLETAAIAIRAAMTGHRVFSTIHANTAPDAINTLINMNVRPFLITSSLLCILAQRLVRRLCTECREAYEPEPDLLQELEIKPGSGTIYRAKGCEKCNNTGYMGRTAAYELLRVTPSMKKAILAEKSLEQIIKIARSEGMKSLLEKGVNKVLDGTSSIEEVIRVLRF
ncbi:MAG: type II/IV secretion system protein [Candidatus Abyssobacteria bacterium SURF_17]|uniref:Type II/IV secretion system protein n=1 Tax=Candidatus Abyssobacteria bacterium SURF_17 TaxID=2093361 RepID=A0A419F9C2_9BACT|nr:MAG: type II/IV secretion system protein [Candidatus Abyssubacteria bacterium SURF_17]